MKNEATCISCKTDGEVHQALYNMSEDGWEFINVIYQNEHFHLFFKRSELFELLDKMDTRILNIHNRVGA